MGSTSAIARAATLLGVGAFVGGAAFGLYGIAYGILQLLENGLSPEEAITVALSLILVGILLLFVFRTENPKGKTPAEYLWAMVIRDE